MGCKVSWICKESIWHRFYRTSTFAQWNDNWLAWRIGLILKSVIRKRRIVANWYWIENSTTKAIAFVEKIDNMLQRRQIVVKALVKQIDIEYPVCIKYTSTSFHSISWMLISVNVTIYRTAPPRTCQSISHCILLTTELARRNI